MLVRGIERCPDMLGGPDLMPGEVRMVENNFWWREALRRGALELTAADSINGPQTRLNKELTED